MIARADPARDDQWVEIRTAEKPSNVRVDPLHSTEDWDRRNNVSNGIVAVDGRATVLVPDWPFLTQSDRNRQLVAVGPELWYTGPGGLTTAVRLRSSYAALNDVAWDARELGLGVSAQVPRGAPGIEHLHGWLSFSNPELPFFSRPHRGTQRGRVAAWTGSRRPRWRRSGT